MPHAYAQFARPRYFVAASTSCHKHRGQFELIGRLHAGDASTSILAAARATTTGASTNTEDGAVVRIIYSLWGIIATGGSWRSYLGINFDVVCNVRTPPLGVQAGNQTLYPMSARGTLRIYRERMSRGVGGGSNMTLLTQRVFHPVAVPAYGNGVVVFCCLISWS